MLDFWRLLFYNSAMFEDSFYQEYALICKTIVNPIRLKIIELIGDRKLNVSEIQAQINISMSNLSNHLTALHRVGVVGREKKGNFIYYYLVEPQLLEVLKAMRFVVHSIASRRNRMMIDSNLMTGSTMKQEN
jgi:DNA-binding transcriptional ArsR family regulator